VETVLHFLLIDFPEAFLFLMTGFATFHISVKDRWKKGLLFSLLFSMAGILLTYLEIPYQPKVLSMFVIMNILLVFLFKEKLVLSVFMSTSAFVFSIIAEFIVIIGFSIFQIDISAIFENIVYQYLAGFSYLTSLALPALVMYRLQFDLRRFSPQKRHNRYLLLLVLVGSIEFLLILFINTSYILQWVNSSYRLISLPEQLALIQFLILAMFLVMVFLFRTYLFLTINRVEEETETPYIQNINDLLTAIRSLKHDAINHYTVIHGFLQKEMYDHGREYVKQQLQEAATIERIVESSGQVVEGIKSPAVTALIHSKMAICLADRITFSIHVTCPSQFSFIKSNDLITVLGNLLDNAIRAAQQEVEENRFIRIIWGQDDKEQFFYIENSGPTIPKDKLEHIFDLGFTTKQNGDGGVGLAVVKNVIDRYGGNITVQSENGITSFRIAFSR
jgi:signal transduction histidine kinase